MDERAARRVGWAEEGFAPQSHVGQQPLPPNLKEKLTSRTRECTTRTRRVEGKKRPLPVLPLRHSPPADRATQLYLAACRSRYLRGKCSSQCALASSWTTIPIRQRETSSCPSPAPACRGPAFGTPLGSCQGVGCAVPLASLLGLVAALGKDPWGRCVAASWIIASLSALVPRRLSAPGFCFGRL